LAQEHVAAHGRYRYLAAAVAEREVQLARVYIAITALRFVHAQVVFYAAVRGRLHVEAGRGIGRQCQLDAAADRVDVDFAFRVQDCTGFQAATHGRNVEFVECIGVEFDVAVGRVGRDAQAGGVRFDVTVDRGQAQARALRALVVDTAIHRFERDATVQIVSLDIAIHGFELLGASQIGGDDVGVLDFD